ncbi:unnamed protein product [Umbelopsis ramanniana]
MASDRFGSVSASHRTKAAEKWFKNATGDAKHKTVDKELQRIKNLGVVSVRKRHEDVSSPSPTSSRRESFISNGSNPLKKKASSDVSQTPATIDYGDDMLDSPTEPMAMAIPPPENEVQKMMELESEVSENIEPPKVDSSPFMDETPTMQVVDDATVTERNAINNEDEVNLAKDDDQSVPEVVLKGDQGSVQPVISATQDLQRFVDDSHLPDDDASTDVTVPSGEVSKSRPGSEVELGSTTPMSLQPSKRSSNKSACSSAYSHAESYNSLTVKDLIKSHAHSSPASSFQSTTSASLPVPCGSPVLSFLKCYILVDQAKKTSPEQGDLGEIHEKLLGLVNALNVWHAANTADSAPQGDSSEVEDLRKKVKDLEHKCELQQVDLHERAACHSKLMQDKDLLVRKLTTIHHTEGGGDYTPSDGSPTDPSSPMSKLLNRLSSGSNISSASLNLRSGSRAGSRRLNTRPETPLPPQLPPPRDPLPPIPQVQEAMQQLSAQKEHHEKVVKELLDKLQDQQSKSKITIDTLETRLSAMDKQTLELQRSVQQLESELQAKQRPPPRSSPAPPPPAAAATMPTYNPKKKQSRRSFSLLTMFGKR